MIDDADVEGALALAGLRPGETPAVVAAAEHSRRRLGAARAALSVVEPASGVPVALGSHGRLEAGPCSDLDLAFVQDSIVSTDTIVAAERAECVRVLREAGFDVPEKTFARAVPLRSLLANVGGPSDTHESLTHRALLLTESAWLSGPDRSRAAWRSVFALYRDGQTRGRFMSSLLNDLHRYYRTVCLDYRHKIEEEDKDWALRYLKLRHSRKAWHLANLALHCAARATAPDASHDAWLAERLGLPPLVKLTRALDALGHAGACAEAWRCHDAFLARVSRREVRDELRALRPRDEAASATPATPATTATSATSATSATFAELKANAARFDHAADAIVQRLLDDPRTREHLVRFGLL